MIPLSTANEGEIMTVEESYDSHLTTVWNVLDGWRTIAVCYTKEDAEACKVALEKLRADKAEAEKRMW